MMYTCVLKTALDESHKIQWQGLYVDGKKVIESFSLHLDTAINIFAPGQTCEQIEIYEDDFESIQDAFPEYEDFTYLLDYQFLYVGKEIWLDDGMWKVSDITLGYRPNGFYETTEWKYLTPIKKMIWYQGHEVCIFNVKGKLESFVWEDYNYQQSYLYEYFTNKN